MQGNKWLRAVPMEMAITSLEPNALTIHISLQPIHAEKIGVAHKSDLTGPGAFDMKFTSFAPQSTKWTFDEAVEYCTERLKTFDSDRWAGGEGANDLIVDHYISLLEGSRLGRAIHARNNQSCVEVIIPQATLTKLIDDTQSEMHAFLILQACGERCLKMKNFDCQPNEFREWFMPVLLGRTKPPGKKPKSWTLIPRDMQIFELVRYTSQNLETTTHNDSTGFGGAIDAVATAARQIRLSGVSSYSNVKAIYYRIKNETEKSVGTITK